MLGHTHTRRVYRTVSEYNELLRTARERLPSTQVPGSCASRAEVAEAVNRYLYDTTGQVYTLDAHYVAKLERGVVRWPNRAYRAGLRYVLAVSEDASLGFTPPRRADRRPVRPASDGPANHDNEIDDVNRKQFLTSALGVGIGAVAARPVSGSADLTYAVSAPTAHYRRLESAVPTVQLARTVEAHLNLAAQVVAAHDSPTGYGALAEVAGLAAWLAADRQDTFTARQRYREAIEHARHAGNDLLAVYMRGSLGQFAIGTGDTDQGIALLVNTERQLPMHAPDAARAWLASLIAQGYADRGDADRSRAALHQAESLTARDGADVAWPWLFPFDTAKAARYQAETFARLGDVRAAQDAYESAHPALTAPKPCALAQLAQARIRARVGRVGESCQLAVQALHVGHAYGSERILAQVRDFRSILPTHTVETAELDDAIAGLYEGQA